MKRSHVIFLFITLLATLLLSGCFSSSSDAASALVSTDKMQLIDSQTVYPNPQDTANKEDRVYYTVEVYATRSARPGERVWKGRRLYNERIYFDGNSVKEIYVDGRGEIRPGSPGRPGQEEYCPDSQYDRVR